MIDWQRFRELGGDPRINFEKMWRHLVSCCYGAYGVIREHKNMPGVEFTLELTRDHAALGKLGDVVAWQCKFVDETESDGSPSTSVKSQIKKSLTKAKKYRKCYLCTNASKLLKDDEDWIETESRNIGCSLEWQIDEDVENRFREISGGTVLRESYLGELALTDKELEDAWRRSIEPVAHRFNEAVFTKDYIEYQIRHALLEQQDWSREEPVCESAWLGGKDLYLSRIEKARMWLKDKTLTCRASCGGKPSLYQRLYEDFAILQSARKRLLLDIRQSLICVMADAGCGKTCFGISMTRPVPGLRPAGCFLCAKDMRDSGIDGLARMFHFRSRPAQNFDEILSAFNAIGLRCGIKMPIVIDGLNECDDPRQWKGILSRIGYDVSTRYPHVAIIVTYRSGQPAGPYAVNVPSRDFNPRRDAYTELCIPKEVCGVAPVVNELTLWDSEIMWGRYKAYYKILCNDSLPQFLKHPLAMSLFCAAVNKQRSDVVFLKDIPKDLSEIFRRFCSEACEKIVESRAIQGKAHAEDVRAGLFAFGRLLLASGMRWVPIADIRSIPAPAGVVGFDWVSVLREECFGLEYYNGKDNVFEVSYDALGGYLIAETMLRDRSLNVSVGGHALSEDIVSSLVHLYGHANHGRYIRVEHPEIDPIVSARCIARIPDIWIGDSLVRDVIAGSHTNDSVLRAALTRVFTDPYGVFGVRYLDELLAERTSGARDRVWGAFIVDNLRLFEKLLWSVDSEHWREDLILMKWMLSSVCQTLRDRASHVLHQIGLNHPRELLEAAVSSFSINDQYIVERMSTAAYGVIMALSIDKKHREWRSLTLFYANEVYEKVLSHNAPYPQSHKWIIDTLVNSIALSIRVTENEKLNFLGSFTFPYKARFYPFRKEKDVNQEQISLVSSSIHMDFENYTLTRLVGNHPYQTGTKNYRRTRDLILQRMYDLGYRYEDYADKDAWISAAPAQDSEEGCLFLERFGKKYQQIAHAEMMTWAHVRGVRKSWQAELRYDSRDFDDYRRESRDDWPPFFWPEAVPFPYKLPELIIDQNNKLVEWLRNGKVVDVAKMLSGDVFGDGKEWLLLHAFIEQDRLGGYESFVKVSGFLLPYEHAAKVAKIADLGVRACESRDYRGLCYWEFPWSRQCDWDPDAGERGEIYKKPLLSNDVEMPFCSVGTGNRQEGSRENVSRFAYLPDPFLCRAMELHQSVDNLNWYDANGNVAVQFYFRPMEYGEKREDDYSLLFIRKDVLESYCELRQCQYVQYTRGERLVAYSVVESDADFYKRNGLGHEECEFEFSSFPLSVPAESRSFEESAEKIFRQCPDVQLVVSNEWAGGDVFGVDSVVEIRPFGGYSDAGVMLKWPKTFNLISRRELCIDERLAVKRAYLARRDSVFVLHQTLPCLDSDHHVSTWRLLSLMRSLIDVCMIRWTFTTLMPSIYRCAFNRIKKWRDSRKRHLYTYADLQVLRPTLIRDDKGS